MADEVPAVTSGSDELCSATRTTTCSTASSTTALPAIVGLRRPPRGRLTADDALLGDLAVVAQARRRTALSAPRHAGHQERGRSASQVNAASERRPGDLGPGGHRPDRRPGPGPGRGRRPTSCTSAAAPTSATATPVTTRSSAATVTTSSGAGLDHDRLFGGYGADDLDLKKRSGDPSVHDEVRGDEDRGRQSVAIDQRAGPRLRRLGSGRAAGRRRRHRPRPADPTT